MSSCICCHCEQSTMSKQVTVISILDLLTSVLFVIYETSNFGLLTGIIQPRADWNCTENCTTTLAEYIPEKLLSRFDFETFTVMCMIVLVFLGFIIEGTLYSKLKTGKRLYVHLFCKQWFEWRIILFLITIVMGVGKYLRGFYSLKFDGVIDIITKTYRIITVAVVKCLFMKELELTVGIHYVKPPKPRKKGSLSLPAPHCR